MVDWQLMEDANAVAEDACRLILEAAVEARARHGAFHLVLAGGSTPEKTYHLLAASPADLSHWHLYYGDERCLPPEDAERNSRMVELTGLSARVAAHHPMPAELGAEQGALAYQAVIEKALPFDLVLLGMGEDGHTASLFPGHQWDDAPVIPVHNSPKPPPDRVSLSPQTLAQCRRLLVLVTGEGKRAALAAWRAGTDLPVARLADLPQASVLVPADLLEGAA